MGAGQLCIPVCAQSNRTQSKSRKMGRELVNGWDPCLCCRILSVSFKVCLPCLLSAGGASLTCSSVPIQIRARAVRDVNPRRMCLRMRVAWKRSFLRGFSRGRGLFSSG